MSTMPWHELLGYIAAFLTTGSFVPQVWHTLRTRDVSGISLTMYLVFALGVSLWLIYGWILAAWPIVLANLVTLALVLLIIAMKLRFRQSGAR